MKPTRRIKKINGIEYWYEASPTTIKKGNRFVINPNTWEEHVNGEPVRVSGCI